MNQEYQWVNKLKAIGILFVVIGHLNTPLTKFIFTWHMPLFFFCAGFFINEELDIKFFVIKNLKRMMIPYFLFGSLGVAVEILKRNVLNRDSVEYFSMFKGLLIDMDSKGLLGHYGFLLWFLPCLFVARVILQGLLRFKVHSLVILVITLLSLGVSFYFDAPFAIDNGFGNIIWVYLGYLFFQRFSSFNLGEPKIFCCLAVCFALFIVSPLSFIKLDIASKTYGNLPLNFIYASFFILFFISFSQLSFLKKNSFDFLNLIGVQSMLVYVLHPYTNNIAYVLGKGVGWPLYAVVAIFLAFMITFIRAKLPSWRVLKYV